MNHQLTKKLLVGSFLATCHMALANQPWTISSATISKSGECKSLQKSELRSATETKLVELACFRSAIEQSFLEARKTTEDGSISVVGWQNWLFTQLKPNHGTPEIIVTKFISPAATQIIAVAIDANNQEVFVLDRLDRQERQVLVYRLAAGGLQAPIRVLRGSPLNFASSLMLDKKANEFWVLARQPDRAISFTRQASIFGGNLSTHRATPLRTVELGFAGLRSVASAKLNASELIITDPQARKRWSVDKKAGTLIGVSDFD